MIFKILIKELGLRDFRILKNKLFQSNLKKHINLNYKIYNKRMLKETQIKFFFNIKRNYEHIEKTE
jgi:hypothetical protein